MDSIDGRGSEPSNNDMASHESIQYNSLAKWDRYAAQFSGQHMTGFMLFICFGYYYKALIHLFHVPGYPDKDPPLYQGTDINHWLELAFYCPIMWICMHMMAYNVFSVPLPAISSVSICPTHSTDAATAAKQSRRRWHFITEFCVAYFFFAQGAHQIANNLEMYSRQTLHLEGTKIHEVIYFFDENLTHIMQFIPMYAIFFLVTIHDAPGRFVAPIVTCVAGAGHGVENAIGIIEGNQPWIVGPAVLSMFVAAYLRWRWRYNRDTEAIWKDFFFRYMIMKGIMMSIAVAAWGCIFGLYVQSHELPMWQVAAFGIIATFSGIGVMLGWDYIRNQRAPANSTYSAITSPTHVRSQSAELMPHGGRSSNAEFEEVDSLVTSDHGMMEMTTQQPLKEN